MFDHRLLTESLLFLCMHFMGKSLYFLGALFFLWSCGNNSNEALEVVDYIPQSTETVVKIKRLETTLEDYDQNPFLKQLKNEPFAPFFKQYAPFLKAVKTTDEILLCKGRVRDSLYDFTLIGTHKAFQFLSDSISEIQNSNIQVEKHQILKSVLGKNTIYSTRLDSILILSTSEKVFAEILANKTNEQVAFQKAFKVKNDKELTYVRALKNSTERAWGTTASFELQLLPDGLVAHGVLLDQDSLRQKIAVSRNQIPQKTDAPRVIPSNAKRALSFSYSNAEALEHNLNFVRNDSLVLDPIFETSSEIVQMKLNEGNALVLKSLDTGLSWDHLARFVSESSTYRDVKIYSLSEEYSGFNALNPIFEAVTYKWVFEWEEFIFFTETSISAENLITSLLNETVLAKGALYESTATYLAQSSSIISYEMQGSIEGITASLLDVQRSTIQSFPLVITQLIYDRNFAHLNLIAKQTSAKATTQGLIQQLAVIPLEKDLLLPPKFFTNHNTMGQDIVVQDRANQLYFISPNGKVLWKKPVDGAILGSIQEVDLLRNGKKQLAFTTKNSLHIIDRNGNPVAPFPKKFKDPITQPLAIFDYDNNRKYRFIIVQKNQVFMYDNQGKTVEGFNFKKAPTTIVLPPQHIRIGNKDYILIAEESGTLNILSRVGTVRVPVSKKFKFSDIPVEREGSNFVVITKDPSKETIAQNGQITSQNLDVTSQYWFTISGNMKVTLDDNLLRIDGKLTELPVGVFQKPQIFTVNNKRYIAVTEIEEKKVYVFDKAGTLLKHFPVYGSSQVDLGDANRNQKLNILVKGQENEILLYQAN